MRRWPRRGTLVVFREPGTGTLAIKRVAARPGDWVPFADGWLQMGDDEAWLLGDADDEAVAGRRPRAADRLAALRSGAGRRARGSRLAPLRAGAPDRATRSRARRTCSSAAARRHAVRDATRPIGPRRRDRARAIAHGRDGALCRVRR